MFIIPSVRVSLSLYPGQYGADDSVTPGRTVVFPGQFPMGGMDLIIHFNRLLTISNVGHREHQFPYW